MSWSSLPYAKTIPHNRCASTCIQNIHNIDNEPIHIHNTWHYILLAPTYLFQ
jgi:hypothetical protein